MEEKDLETINLEKKMQDLEKERDTLAALLMVYKSEIELRSRKQKEDSVTDSQLHQLTTQARIDLANSKSTVISQDSVLDTQAERQLHEVTQNATQKKIKVENVETAPRLTVKICEMLNKEARNKLYEYFTTPTDR